MNIKERLREYCNEKGVKVATFERTTGLSEGYVHKMKSLGSDILERIKQEYPDMDLNWLITGKGETPQNSRTTAEWLSVVKELTRTNSRLEKELKAERGKKTTSHSGTGRTSIREKRSVA
jgi:monoamine oxidase